MTSEVFAMLMSLLAYVPFLMIALLAQWSDRSRWARWAAYGMLLALDGIALLVGLAALLASQILGARGLPWSQYPGLEAVQLDLFGLLVAGTALLVPLALLPMVRRCLARFISIRAESHIHALALGLAVLAVGLNLAQVPLIGGLEVMAASTAQIPFMDLVLSNVPIVLFALAGVGFMIRRSPRETWRRLGLERMTWRQLGLTVGLAAVILALYYGLDWVWRLLAPDSYEMMMALGEVLYGGAMGVWQGIAVSLVAGVVEELFFRGALQPRFGFWLTAVIFTAAHVQYGFTLAAVEVFLGALALGWLRQRENTTSCILLHALYNVVGLLIFPLLP
ncbi:MAG TPA: CPBP family intramembrane metalloprotease [Chloroflexi bacterium]|nr:CPBP family intramembrane metalloprotease [Chloroflexota bacterium]